MKLPRHISLTIEFQPHAVLYQTIEEWLDDRHVGGANIGGITAADRAAMIETGTVCVIHWHPDTPVGSCSVVAATLERALKLANQ